MRKAIPLFDYYNLREGYTRDEPKKIILNQILCVSYVRWNV
jgi:hypothetical protein